ERSLDLALAVSQRRSLSEHRLLQRDRQPRQLGTQDTIGHRRHLLERRWHLRVRCRFAPPHLATHPRANSQMRLEALIRSLTDYGGLVVEASAVIVVLYGTLEALFRSIRNVVTGGQHEG